MLELPLRFVFIKAATAPSLESASIVTTISGEFVVKTATISLETTPTPLRNSANRLTSQILLLVDCNFQARCRKPTHFEFPISPRLSFKP